ncbi:Integral membrane protein [Pleurostoma richardsiae]|uniref:Integral membrane protein n=1 Tax=Pleurostoma richardsiae TaxID=41990 RepID=A0AA38RQY8_9PEZI|nr:Integral membrane protein [Pleurostoma richardsiae]
MALYSDPPPVHSFNEEKPTLLVCWWITLFCTVIILLRVAGRFIRTERLFMEDRVAALALIPLYARMGCVHVVLNYGTNNNDFTDVSLSDEDVRRRQIGSGLVLASRFFYAATLWILKNTTLEFFKRLTGVTWERSYRVTLLIIRCTLGATFVAVLISDLAECHPFTHYWQVLPDPGGQCRQGYAQLLTMAVCNILTDLLLVFFPVPIIIRSHMSVKRKIQLVLLFSLSLSVVGVTLYRVPHVIDARGSQQLRSLLASVELLFATAASNALVLGSFVRDRGVKKRKFKYGSFADSVDRTSETRSRRPTVGRQWGSDEDLVRDIGLGLNADLRDLPDSPGAESGKFYPPAPIGGNAARLDKMDQWQFPDRRKSGAGRSDDSLLPRDQLSPMQRSNSSATPRRVSFFDVGGLLSTDDSRSTSRRDSYLSSVDPLSPHSAPSPTMPASATGYRRGSQALLQDLGGLLGSHDTSARSRGGTELQPIPRESPYESHYDSGGGGPVLMDAGGLLRPPKV